MNQYIVNFTNDDNFLELRQKGRIVYRSLVLNVLFLRTTLSQSELEQLSGVTFVKPMNQWITSNKK